MVNEDKFAGISITQNNAEPVRSVERSLVSAVDRCGELVTLVEKYTEEVMGADTRPVAPALPASDMPEGLLGCMHIAIMRLHDKIDKLEHVYHRLNSGN